jgi:phage host-nuclease inhibitor protein Gam
MTYRLLPDPDADFDEWLSDRAGTDASWDEIYPEPEDSVAADRLLGVLRYLHRQVADVETVYQARTAELQEWRAERQNGLLNRVAHIERLLEGWTRAQHKASGGRDKTWNLPNGKLTLRQAQTRLDFHGEEDAVAGRLQDRFGDAAIRVQRKIAKSWLKDRVIAGPVDGAFHAPPGYEARAVMAPDGDGQPTGEVIPDLILFVPTHPAFKATPTPPKDQT